MAPRNTIMCNRFSPQYTPVVFCHYSFFSHSHSYCSTLRPVFHSVGFLVWQSAAVTVSTLNWRRRGSAGLNRFHLCTWGTNSSWVRHTKQTMAASLYGALAYNLLFYYGLSGIHFCNFITCYQTSGAFTREKVNYGFGKNILPKWEMTFLLTFPLINCYKLSCYPNSFTVRSCKGFYFDVNLILASDALN